MLNKSEFKEKIKAEVMEYLPEMIRTSMEIGEVEVVKMNDQKLHGLTFRREGSDAAPTLYLEDAYARYESGAEIMDIARELADTAVLAERGARPPEIDLSWDKVKDNLTVRLVEKRRNRDFLRDKPYMSVGNGLAVMVDINMDRTETGDWRIAVNNDIAAQNRYDREELLHTAMENAGRVDPPVLFDMSAALFSPIRENLLDRSEPIDPSDVAGMFVLSNESGSFGAAALFAAGMREKVADVIGDSYYVLPSSVHETIIVPQSQGIDEKDLVEMVKQANRSVVEPKDILSDNVYHYDRDSRSLDRVGPNRERGDRVAEGR